MTYEDIINDPEMYNEFVYDLIETCPNGTLISDWLEEHLEGYIRGYIASLEN